MHWRAHGWPASPSCLANSLMMCRTAPRSPFPLVRTCPPWPSSPHLLRCEVLVPVHLPSFSAECACCDVQGFACLVCLDTISVFAVRVYACMRGPSLVCTLPLPPSFPPHDRCNPPPRPTCPWFASSSCLQHPWGKQRAWAQCCHDLSTPKSWSSATPA